MAVICEEQFPHKSICGPSLQDQRFSVCGDGEGEGQGNLINIIHLKTVYPKIYDTG